MKRRSRTGGELIKGRRRKTPEPKRRNTPKAVPRSKSSATTEETEVARLTRELSDERKQRTATSEVLHLLSGSHGDLPRLFNTILTSATKLCQANFGTLSLYEEDAFRIVAMHDVPPALAELRRREPLVRAGPLLRIAETKRLLHIADYTEYVASHPADSDAAAFAKLTGVRTMLGVPMLKDGGIVGAIVVYQQEVRAFSDREIALLKSFAAQAVIAIENARLLNELRRRTDDLSQRTTELTEALEQQTATSDVLQVISRSPGDLEPVFASMLEKAVRICDATFGNIYRWDGEFLTLVAVHNTPPAFADARRLPRRPNPNNIFGRMLATNAVVHIPDAAQLSKGGNREYDTAVELGGVRTCLAVPMLKGHELIGSISLFRQKVRRFNDKQIASLTNFAAQAVIAIENARLLSELRGALERQTATSEVLQAISSSPGDLEPVFATMLENAIRICDAKFGNIYRAEGDGLRNVATHNTPTAFAEALRSSPYLRPGPRNPVRRMINTKTIVHVVDVRATEAYAEREPIAVASVELGGTRTLMIVPMLKDNELVGAFTLARQEVRPFTDKQIALVQNFAAQAVIAIENARLLNELRQRTTDLTERTADLTEALEQQTATSEVLQVISGSPSDLQPVFATMLEKAVRICDATFGNVYRWDGEALHLVATRNTPPAFAEARRRSLGRRDDKNQMLALILANKKPLHVADAAALPGYINRSDLAAVQTVELGGVRSLLAVPMLKEGELIGGFTVYRQEVRPFTDKQIELVKNFAAQAVIAIENARLLNELRQRTDDLTQRTTELTEALEQQTATSNVLQVISSSPGDLQPVFATMLEKAVRICDATFGNIFRWDGEALHIAATHNTPPAFVEARRRLSIRFGTKDPVGQMITNKKVVHIADLAEERDYIERNNEGMIAAVELGGVRTHVVVPMLKDNELIGTIHLSRQEVRPFTDKQIALVTNFAAQAVIAIENARLLNELRQRTTDLTERTADLTEALEQQTATSEVLQVISSSPGDLEPVFASMLENAVRICDAKFGNIYRWDGDALRLAASHNTPQAYAEHRRRSPLRFDQMPESLRRMVATTAPIQVEDILALSGDVEKRNPVVVAGAELGGIRTVLNVPMLKENKLVGAFIVSRQEVRPFTDKQIDLVKNFAAQAVIAIENARLLNELRQSLEQQMATGEILSSMSGSIADTKPVFNAIVRNLLRLFGTRFATIMLLQDGMIYLPAVAGEPGFERLADLFPRPLGDESFSGRAMLLKEPFQFAPLVDNPAVPPFGQQNAREFGYNSIVFAPMIMGDKVVGAIGTAHREAKPFSEQQVALLRAFADQAVIAIENARLLKELRERTEEVEKLNQQLEQRVADQVGEIERMGRLRRFLPPQVADLIVASGSEKQLESHRREITALFCDLRGFTGFTESADAEDVMALLRDYHAAIGEIIIKYNGTLERYAGDGVMVVFNDPVPVENPALQAVLMALEVRDAIGALTETWRRWGHDIGFGIGIAHGFATLGTIGFEGRFDYAAIGTVSNVASRLCDEAKPRQILISPRVLTKVENAVTVEPVGEFELKGIRRPLVAYNVVAIQSSDT